MFRISQSPTAINPIGELWLMVLKDNSHHELWKSKSYIQRTGRVSPIFLNISSYKYAYLLMMQVRIYYLTSFILNTDLNIRLCAGTITPSPDQSELEHLGNDLERPSYSAWWASRPSTRPRLAANTYHTICVLRNTKTLYIERDSGGSTHTLGW